MIRFACASCQTTIKVHPNAAGKKLNCPKCGQRLQVPDPSIAETVQGILLRPGAVAGEPAPYYPMPATADIAYGSAAPSRGGYGFVLVICGLLSVGVVAGAVGFVLWRGHKTATPTERPPDNPPVVVTPAPELPKELTTQQIVEKSKPSVALIRHRFGSGTGFVVRPNLVVTNAHVVAGDLTAHFKVYFPADSEEKALTASLVYEDHKRDLAVLRIKATRSPLPIAETFQGKGGEKIIIIGNPRSPVKGEVIKNVPTEGLMGQIYKIGNENYYQLSATVNPGNSGGPVLDAKGQIIAVVCSKPSKESEVENMTFAIPLPDLQEALRKCQSLTEADDKVATAHHDLGVVFKRVAAAANLYANGLDHYAASMQKSVQNNENPSIGLDRASKQIEAEVEEKNERFLAPVKAAISQVTSDKRLPGETRQKMIELWDLYIQMKSLFERPRGPVNEFTRKTTDMSEHRKRLIDALKLSIGVELD